MIFFLPILVMAASSGHVALLPIEVVGDDGATAEGAIDVPQTKASQIRSLSMQIHGLSYPDKASVQVNAGAWVALNNDTATVAEPGKSYGGIGGGFATLKLTLPLPRGIVVGGANTIRFRFNHSDGISSGFRVLAFNFVADDGTLVLPAAAFAQEDPDTWTPPLPDPDNIAAGKRLWYDAQLMASNRPDAAALHAHCADCHAQDGRDLKYFNFSNRSIVARSRFHGLSELDGRRIASYIRSLSLPNPGRPWNPPYQPGPGSDAKPAADWAAGAGLAWALDSDDASLPYIFNPAAARQAPLRITAETFRPDGNLNPREIPISLQLPDWNHWLPRIHPLDAWGPDFLRSELYLSYGASAAGLRTALSSAGISKFISTGDIVASFDRWSKSQRKFLASYVGHTPSDWSPALTQKVYSTQLWQLAKTWELEQEFNLEGRGREFYGATGEPRTWFSTIPSATAPAENNIPDGPNGMDGSAVTNEYFDNAWYEVQLLVNSGNHRRHGRQPVDWVYVIDRYLRLYRESHRPEAARLLVAVIKAMQSSDPKIGPENRLRGWQPDGNVDPRIMVSAEWAPMFQTLPHGVRSGVAESMLTAWLDKNLQYRTARYFTKGASAKGYAPPEEIGGISGGAVWKAAPQFQAAGVEPSTVLRLVKWGRAHANMAASLHY